MDTYLEPPWVGELRKALVCAVDELRTGSQQAVKQLESHLDSARELGWKPSDTSHDDLRRTARTIFDMSGSARQFPVRDFLNREVKKNSITAV